MVVSPSLTGLNFVKVGLSFSLQYNTNFLDGPKDLSLNCIYKFIFVSSSSSKYEEDSNESASKIKPLSYGMVFQIIFMSLFFSWEPTFGLFVDPFFRSKTP